MQFRKVGNKFQVFKYTGYNPDNRAPKLVMVASIDALTGDVRFNEKKGDDGSKTSWESLLDAGELAEIDNKASRARSAARADALIDALHGAVKNLADAAKGVKDDNGFITSGCLIGLDADRAAAIWASVVALEKGLSVAGFDRPKRAYKKPSPASDDRQLSLPQD